MNTLETKLIDGINAVMINTTNKSFDYFIDEVNFLYITNVCYFGSLRTSYVTKYIWTKSDKTLKVFTRNSQYDFLILEEIEEDNFNWELSDNQISKNEEIINQHKGHDQYMLDKICELGKRDVLYVSGDFIFDKPKDKSFVYNTVKYLQENAKCRIKLVMGNHDSKELYLLGTHQTNIPTVNRLELQLPLFSYKKYMG